MLIGIVAIAENYAIGKNGRLPWHYSSDLKFFKRTTLNSTIVMGFNTWESIGKPLPKRFSIVLSRSREIEHQARAILMRDKKEVIALSKYLKGDMFLIGGAETYKSFADSIGKWIVTEIPETIEDADAFMQDDFLVGFEQTKKIPLEKGLNVKIFERN